MNKEIKGIIFDWAGTTVDYGCFAPVVTFLEVFKKYKIELTLEEVMKPMGIHKKEHIRQLLLLERVKGLWKELFNKYPDESDIDELYSLFEPILISNLKDFAKPNPFVIDTINKLKKMNLLIGSTTGYTRKMMDELIPYANKAGYYPDNIVTSDEVIKGRPQPFMCYKNALDLGLYPLECVMKVGDTIADIKEGVNASMWSVGIIMGSSLMGMTLDDVNNCSEEELKNKMKTVEQIFYDNGANFVITDIRELIPLIKIVNKKLANGERP